MALSVNTSEQDLLQAQKLLSEVRGRTNLPLLIDGTVGIVAVRMDLLNNNILAAITDGSGEIVWRSVSFSSHDTLKSITNLAFSNVASMAIDKMSFWSGFEEINKSLFVVTVIPIVKEARESTKNEIKGWIQVFTKADQSPENEKKSTP